MVFPGLSWVVGDGKSIRFWKDAWMGDRPLLEYPEHDIPGDLIDLKVRDLWRNGSGWVMSQITPFVSHHVRLQLGARIVDSVTGVSDRVSWGACQDGQFTVKSAFSSLTRDETPRQCMERF